MTIGELIGSSGYELNVIVIFEFEPFGYEAQLQFNSGCLANNIMPIHRCRVSDWKVEGERTIKIWSGDKLKWQVINS